MAFQAIANLLGGDGSSVDFKSIKEDILIILPIPAPKDELKALQEKFPSSKVTFETLKFVLGNAWVPERELDPNIYKDCTILMTLSALPPNGKGDAPHLRWIHFFSAGINSSTEHPIWKDESITLTTSSGVHGPQIAEWFLMTLLVQSHAYNILHDQQKAHNWGKQISGMTSVRDLVGQRLGVLGYGSIGRQVARVGKAMGMEVYAYTASPKDTKESRADKGFIVPGTGDAQGEFPSKWFSGLEKDNLHDFLKQDLDVMLISVPLTKETKGFLSTAEFDILAKNKCFVSNISRGQIIDQPALIEALKEGKLRGAALDVTDPEPLPKDSPLWDMENVTVTPHVSGVGSSYTGRCFAILEGNIERNAKGEKMWNVVNRERGY